ncbi:MAG: plasmid pRiA4b ORF-3 family protein [Candidatus Methanoperedenaceae archaeon]|nr:plasmid pRiA4b ORF-3 family protein [Euryarchaeota archaeon]MCG2727175.1 plasmid pRiA4b ORF-3 family protein [Candidatus Methanoperedenaceae archaeon]
MGEWNAIPGSPLPDDDSSTLFEPKRKKPKTVVKVDKGKTGDPFFLPFVSLFAILYLFDFGDMWRFRVELEEIRAEGDKPRNPKIIEKKGKAPEQYG